MITFFSKKNWEFMVQILSKCGCLDWRIPVHSPPFSFCIDIKVDEFVKSLHVVKFVRDSGNIGNECSTPTFTNVRWVFSVIFLWSIKMEMVFAAQMVMME